MAIFCGLFWLTLVHLAKSSLTKNEEKESKLSGKQFLSEKNLWKPKMFTIALCFKSLYGFSLL